MNTPKTALITGANRGIGLEVARQLLEEGFHVFLGARNREAGERAVASLLKDGMKIDFVELEVTSEESIREAVQAVANRSGRLDALVNNAAILEDEKLSVFEISAAVLQKTLMTNTIAPFLLAQAFVPLLMKSQGGRIINVSSGAGSLNEMGTYAPAYSISKAALNAVTVQLSAALKSKGIAVNSVCPGWVRTDMGGGNAPRSVQKGAETIVWLASMAPQNLTGQFWRDRKVIAW
ncbi:MAG: SDR family oxidoreductase [bacterium]